MAVRFAPGRKATLDFIQTFQSIATIPQQGIVKDGDLIDFTKMTTFEEPMQKVYQQLLFFHPLTIFNRSGLSYIKPKILQLR